MQAARALHTDEEILPYALEALTGRPGEVARTTEPPVTLAKILARLKEFYGECSSFIATSREATKLRKGDNETVTDFGVDVLTSVNRMLRTFPAHMRDREREECLKETLFLGLPPHYQGQLSHIKSDRTKTFHDMVEMARSIESRIETFRSIHVPKKDGNKNNSNSNGFGKTYNLPSRHLKGNTVTNRSAVLEGHVGEESEDLAFESASYEDEVIPGEDIDQEIQRYSNYLCRAVQTKYDLDKGNPPKRDGYQLKCRGCDGPHFIRDCPHLSTIREYLKTQGKMHFLEKGGTIPPAQNNRTKPQQ